MISALQKVLPYGLRRSKGCTLAGIDAELKTCQLMLSDQELELAELGVRSEEIESIETMQGSSEGGNRFTCHFETASLLNAPETRN